MPAELVGVGRFELPASSSRSQLAVSTASAASCLTWERLSVSVRWRPLLALAIVTHLVTQLRAGFGLATWMQTTGMALLATEHSVTRTLEPESGSRYNDNLGFTSIDARLPLSCSAYYRRSLHKRLECGR
jgi:hypothetical protein